MLYDAIQYYQGCISWIMLECFLVWEIRTVYPTKYAHGFCFAVLCCGYTLTDFPISIRLTSLALWQSNDCPSASKATLMNMDKYFMWIHYERLHNHNKAKHNKTVCIFLGIYCMLSSPWLLIIWKLSDSSSAASPFNPLRAKFFRGNLNIYLYFISLLHIDMTQVLKILPQVRSGLTYFTLSISWLLMSWRRKERGHQQPWYWHS